MIFVFGSNEAGRHGRGAALRARQAYGAVNGVGAGIQGKSYGIPTKDRNLKVLGIAKIKQYVENFITYAENNFPTQFYVTRIGCGLARLEDADMAILFEGAPSNCLFDRKWQPYLGDNYRYFEGQL